MAAVEVFDDTVCELGEGPLWHPERRTLLWFDIRARALLVHDHGSVRRWPFDGAVSAAGWIDHDRLLVAHEQALLRFDLVSGERDELVPLEPGEPRTRANDGRADPWGGFWIGTMGKALEPGLGAIYRYYRGELRRVFAPITIPNAIAFAPERGTMTFADTPTRKIWRQSLAPKDGWPLGEPELFVDYGAEGPLPDGAVFDSEGCLWVAHYGAGRVVRHGPEGEPLMNVVVPAHQTTCPAFGGPDLRSLFITTAAQGLGEDPHAGRTYATRVDVAGRAEERVVL